VVSLATVIEEGATVLLPRNFTWCWPTVRFSHHHTQQWVCIEVIIKDATTLPCEISRTFSDSQWPLAQFLCASM